MNIEGYDIDLARCPHHIAIIMDGNGRWAKKRTLKRIMGHRKGVEVLMNIIKVCKELNINVLSVFAFSTENWKRPKEEISGLMNLFSEFFEKKFQEIKKEQIKIIHTGIMTDFPSKIQKIIKQMEKETINLKGPILNLVLNYGGKLEIIDSAKKIAENVKMGNLAIDDIDEDTFSANLYHPELKDPDLLIRTSGEIRLSNFMLWQLAYTELWFTDVLWPDFNKKEFVRAIYEFQKRERRFGEVK